MMKNPPTTTNFSNFDPTYLFYLGSALVIFLIKDIYFGMKDKNKDLVSSMQQLHMAITKLTVQMEYLEKKIEMIPLLQQEIDILQRRVMDFSINGEK